MITHHGDYGRIINISTDASQVFAGQITYGASKATLEALTRSIGFGNQFLHTDYIVFT
jgi:3-oxoacyl-[acyl-carrier protein] reductase